MSSQYYTPTGNPPAQSRGTSPTIRAEYSLVDAGFQKLPTPAQVWADAQNYAADTGTVNAYAVTIAATFLTSYFAGMKVKFKAGNTNTGASTLSVNALGNIAIVRPDGVTALTAGTIVSGQIVECIYDGLSFQMANSANVTSNNDPGAIQKQTYVAFTTAGTGTAYTLAALPVIASYTANLSFFVTFHVGSGASPTLNVNGLGATVNLVKQQGDGTYTNIVVGDIQTGHHSRVTFLNSVQALVEILPASGKLIGVQVISATQVYTPSPGTNRVRVLLQGGGGAGGGAVATGAGQVSAGAGGSAGGWAESLLSSGFSGVTVTIGGGGLGALGGTGGNGGTTSFGAVFSATGGLGGPAGAVVSTANTNLAVGPVGGTGSGGNVLNSMGGSGGLGIYSTVQALGGAGGFSYFGAGGIHVTSPSNGTNATARGSGGGGAAQGPSAAALTGGGAAGGSCIVLEFT